MKEFLTAIKAVLDSENNTGCSEDLTVVSKPAIENLKTLFEKLIKKGFKEFMGLPQL